MAKMAGTQRWWAHQVEVFGLGFVLFISFANLLFGILGEWYAIFLAYLLRSIYICNPFPSIYRCLWVSLWVYP